MSKFSYKNGLFLLGLVLLMSLTRILPHPPNFTPIMALSLIAGYYWGRSPVGYLVPLAAMILSDLYIGIFHPTIGIVYLCFFAITLLGSLLAKKSKWQFAIYGSLISAVFFFFTSNLAVWYFEHLYPQTFSGLIDCYVAALPFFHNALAANFIFVPGLMFVVSKLWTAERVLN